MLVGTDAGQDGSLGVHVGGGEVENEDSEQTQNVLQRGLEVVQLPSVPPPPKSLVLLFYWRERREERRLDAIPLDEAGGLAILPAFLRTLPIFGQPVGREPVCAWGNSLGSFPGNGCFYFSRLSSPPLWGRR